jgi:hypothetical protein
MKLLLFAEVQVQRDSVCHNAPHLKMGVESGVKKRHVLGSRMALSISGGSGEIRTHETFRFASFQD